MDSKDVNSLAKLQAFIDNALGISVGAPATASCPGATAATAVSLSALSAVGGSQLTANFLRMAIDGTPEYCRIAASLRRTEAYSMVSFLLQEGQGEKVRSLSARYGISAGHFRRIFRAALGGSPKSALNDWRLATAILALVERQQSVTEVAMAHGFASPSHFSSEVKKSLGQSLTHLFDAQKKQ
ncbi:helix-turn-helix domain-containing protein [Solimicrobium silvestre]|uniref:Helix-turn-helix domain n=1 Tax=Solimicrobium silvestre TaxID=2099400 RepID=A0A2S9H1J1_9BURK|nr:helix-turn-helix domain-containing protein [Solimicrobium silvestre]PRC93855.1 Helix-turn-helix domain [Solimicrobium silvestre]